MRSSAIVGGMTIAHEGHICKLVKPASYKIPQTSEPACILNQISAF